MLDIGEVGSDSALREMSALKEQRGRVVGMKSVRRQMLSSLHHRIARLEVVFPSTSPVALVPSSDFSSKM